MQAPSPESNVSAAEVPDLPPPEEGFWNRYSPHHEFPLSTVSAVAVCALGLGLFLVIYVLGWARRDEAHRPVDMDAVEIAGGGGEGGLGLGSGLAGPAKAAQREDVDNTSQTPPTEKTPPTKVQAFKNPVAKPLDLPKAEPTDKATPADLAIFAEVKATAEEEVRKAMEPPTPKGPPSKGGGGPGDGREPGKDKGRGGGKGGGIGSKVGPGEGDSPTGEVLTKRRKRELRWKIDFSGSGEEHLRKLRALGVTLAFPTRRPGIFLVLDRDALAQSPPRGKLSNLFQLKDKVKWFNVSPQSLQQLAAVLRLSEVPRYAAIFLPDAVEDEMIRLEHDFQGLNEEQIARTDFEIRRRDGGGYGPVVVNQFRRGP
jgi:hypothetical protein